MERTQFDTKFVFSVAGFSIVLIAVLILFPQFKSWLVLLEVAHTDRLDFAYRLLDPVFLWMLTAGWSVSKLVTIANPGLTRVTDIKVIVKKLAIIIVVLLVSIFLLFLVEKLILKPVFHKLRPYEQYQHLVMREMLERDRRESPITVSSALFTCPFGIAYATKTANVHELSADEENILGGVGLYHISISLEKKIAILTRMKLWLDKRNDLWLSRHFEHAYDFNCGRFDACPSGTVLRQVFVFFLALLLRFQPASERNRIFGVGTRIRDMINSNWLNRNWKHFSGSFFLLVNIVVLIIVLWSKLYGYRHNCLEEVISLTAAILFAVLWLLPLSYHIVYSAKKTNELLMDEIPVAVFETDLHGKILHCNKSFLSQFHLKGTDVTGKLLFSSLWASEQQYELFLQILSRSPSQRVENFIAGMRYFELSEAKSDRPFFARIDATYTRESFGLRIRGTMTSTSPMYDQFDLGFFRTDLFGVITFCNSNFARILGYSTPNDVVKHKIQKFLRFYDDFQLDDLGKGEMLEIVTQHLNAQRIDKKVNLYSHSLKHPNQKPYAYEGVIWDMSKTEDLWNMCVAPIYIIQESDHDRFTFTFTNNAFRELFGFTEEELQKIEATSLVSAEKTMNFEHWLDTMKKKVRGQKYDKQEEKSILYYKKKDGSTFQGESVSRSINSYHGRTALFGSIRSIEEEQKIASTRRQAVLAEYGLFMMHMIRTPLAVIMTNACALQDHKEIYLKDESKYRDALSDIFKHTQQIKDLAVEATRSLHDISDGQSNVNLLQCVEQAIEIVNEQLKAKEINVQIEVEEGFRGLVRGSENAIVHMFYHLFINSLDHLNKNGKITVKVFMKETNAEIHFVDDGVGFSSSIPDLDLIFAENFTLHPLASGHSGMGLAFVRRTVASIGGTVRALSVVPHGAEFELVIPIHTEV